jgi:hypothetical protein
MESGAPVAVEALRDLVEPDGARFELVEHDRRAGAVRLRLVLEGVDCRECVMGRDYLEQLSLGVLRRTMPDVQRVIIDDPRDRAAAHG